MDMAEVELIMLRLYQFTKGAGSYTVHTLNSA